MGMIVWIVRLRGKAWEMVSKFLAWQFGCGGFFGYEML